MLNVTELVLTGFFTSIGTDTFNTLVKLGYTNIKKLTIGIDTVGVHIGVTCP